MAGKSGSSDDDAGFPVGEELGQLILENSPHCIAVLDSEFQLVFCNRNFFNLIKSLFGRELYPGQSILQDLPRDRALRWQMRLQEILNGSCTRIEEVIEVQGETRYFDVAYHPLKENGSWNRIVAFFEEITARKQRERRLLDRAKELEESLATRETLLSVVSHDLRSPIFQLNGLLFMIQQAAETRDETRLQMHAEDLEERISHLTHTLDNLLSWANLQRQSLEPQISRFSLKSVFEHAIGLMKPVAQRKGVRIYTQRARNFLLNSDQEMVAFIVRNLVNNAIKFSLQGGKIEVATEEAADRVSFSISDQGIGVEPKRISTLKEGSHYYSEAGTWGERGTGLGLKTCYDFVERLEGTIDFKSIPGKGTCVTVTLPQMEIP